MYDQAGNLNVVEQPTGARTTTTWDDQNRQTGVVQPTGAVTTCTYRFDGLRHSKEDSGGTTKFIWDYENYLAETDNQNEIQAVYTNEPQSYGNLISQYRKGPTIWTPSYHQYDALGSTRALTDGGGNTSDTYVYDAWGNEVASSGATVNPFRWVGRVGYYWDDETGTFYIHCGASDNFEDFLNCVKEHHKLKRYYYVVEECQIVLVYGHGATGGHVFVAQNTPNSRGLVKYWAAGYIGCDSRSTNRRIPIAHRSNNLPMISSVTRTDREWSRAVDKMADGATKKAKSLCAKSNKEGTAATRSK